MRVAICDNQVPFVSGGAERLRHALAEALRVAGVEVECITVPFRWYPATKLAESMLVWQLLDLGEASCRPIDRVIALRFPAYLVNHPSKSVWLLHQHRTAYELYDTSFGDLATFPHGAAAREAIHGADGRALPAARRLFAISHNVAGRLKRGNGLDATVLYPPVPGAATFHFESVGDYVLYASRLDGIKRHGLLVEAMTHTTSSTRCVLAGAGPEGPALRRRIDALGLTNRVQLVGRVSDTELRSLYANALAVFYGPYDEDYGYGTLEAFLSAKSVITLEDSGGPLEFVEAGENGLVVAPNPKSIARAIDALARDKALARRMGLHGRDRVLALDLSWSRIIDALLS
jgi:glycosyltransferase involved in cell wall biosynthesis